MKNFVSHVLDNFWTCQEENEKLLKDLISVASCIDYPYLDVKKQRNLLEKIEELKDAFDVSEYSEKEEVIKFLHSMENNLYHREIG